MKQHVSRIYRILTWFYLIFPVSFLILLGLLYNIPGPDLTKILLQPSYYLLSVLGMVTGWALWSVKRWGWYALRALHLAMIYTSIVLLVHYGQTEHSVAAFFVSVLLVWALDRRISSELRVPYFMPQISWWESNPRFQIRIPAKVRGKRGEQLDGTILDLSMSGCFIKVRPEIPEGETVQIECTLFGRPWKADGLAVWQTFGAVTFPRGLGVRFLELPNAERRALKAATIRLRRLSLLYRRGRYLMGEEELQKTLAKLNAPLPSGQGDHD